MSALAAVEPALAAVPAAARTLKTIKRIFTHVNPHLDELFGIWLLRNFGKHRYPGIGTVPVTYVEDRDSHPDGITVEEAEENGDACLGVFHGLLDEHAANGVSRKAKSSASLVAQMLRVYEDPRLESLIDYVEKNDSGGKTHGYGDYARSIAEMQEAGFPPGAVEASAMMFFTAKYKLAIREERAADEFFRNAKVREFRTSFPESSRTLATVVSDNKEIGKYIRSRRISVALVQSGSGNVGVFSNARQNPDMSDVVAELRKRECRKRGMHYTEEDLYREGSFAFWYWQGEKAQFVLNGARTAKVEPTALTLQEIEEAVVFYAKFNSRA